MWNMFLLFLEVWLPLLYLQIVLLQDLELFWYAAYLLGLVGYPSDDINKFLWMVRIGGGVFPHIKEPDYLVSYLFTD